MLFSSRRRRNSPPPLKPERSQIPAPRKCSRGRREAHGFRSAPPPDPLPGAKCPHGRTASDRARRLRLSGPIRSVPKRLPEACLRDVRPAPADEPTTRAAFRLQAQSRLRLLSGGQRTRKAEPVSGVILHQRLDAIEALRGFLAEFHPFGFQLLVGLTAIRGGENAGPQRAFLDQHAQRIASFLIH